MDTPFPYGISDTEIYRYLGYRGQTPEPPVLEKIQICKKRLMESVTPKAIWKYYDIHWCADGSFLVEDIPIHSKNLSRNLKDCHMICFLAVTLGPAPDRFIQKAEITAMSDAVIYQAISAAMIESYCNHINQVIKDEMMQRGLFTRPRFSPGYGDFPLEFQKTLGQCLQMSKEIGVTLTDSLLMMPSKSVTAVIGIGTTNPNCTMAGCEVCNKSRTCLYRRTPEGE
ncbi:MAG: Vitamin B12 dependent methionine synthase activation subunit [Lachnospiraceae bacterium]|nr:Vitamin B12 dependent methionine synthase activation subunit [Lachnospiraceae bacterium]